MKYIISSVLFFSILFIHQFTYAQNNFKVVGKLVQKGSEQPLVGANLILTNVKDTLDVNYAVADIDGNFYFEGLQTAFYSLTISYVGFKPLKKFVRVNKAIVNISTLNMEEDTELLNELKVEANTITAVQNGDTTQYNANAFKTNPDANAEDLITKLPGIIVDQSGVQAQGEQVQKVLVDGKEFFGSDPSVALKTIPAEVIQKIEVFDQLSDQSQFSGFDDGNTTKTLNIITKPEARDGKFGRVFAGTGVGSSTDNVYNIGGNINSFNGDERLTVLGLSNNINQQNFSDEDVVGIASANSGGRGRGGRNRRGGGRGGFNASGNTNDFLVGQQSGISTTHSFGLNYSNKWNKLILNGSYFYNQGNNDNDQIINRETFADAGTSLFYDETNISRTDNYNHRLNLRLQYKIDDKNTIIFTPTFSFQNNELQDDLVGLNLLSSEEPFSSTNTLYNSQNNGFRQSGTLLYRHAFPVRGRTFSIRFRNSLNETNAESDLLALTNADFEVNFIDSLDQVTNSGSDNNTWSTNVTYTEPIAKNTQLQLNYNYSVNNQNSDVQTFDQIDESNASLNTALSNNFESTYETHRPTVGGIWRKGKILVRAGVAYQNAQLKSNQIFPELANIDQSFQNVLPTGMLRINFSREKNLRFIYRTRTGNPSVSQLQNVIDNSNPLFLSTGNENLGQSYSHTLITRFSNTNVKKSRNFFSFIFLQSTNNQVANATFLARQDSVITTDVILPAGGQLSKPINVDGALNLRSFSTLGLPFKPLKSNININFGATYTRTPGFVNNIENISNTLGTNAGFVIGSNISKQLDFTVSYTANFNVVENSIQPQLNDNYFFQTSRLKFNWIFSKGLVFRSDITHQLYRGLEESFNQDYFLWNLSVGKKLFPKQNGEIRLDVFDLLNQNNSIARTTTETYLEDVISQVINQYFMVSFTYNIRDFKQKKS